jgi:XTP/dITP diphosphohydrolase
MIKLLLATGNPGKAREFMALLQDIAIEVVTLRGIDLKLEVKEVGKTYAENAALKALAYGRASGLLTLGDDSGLEVEALGGAPGLYSARYVPLQAATDADRRAYLLGQLRGLSRPWHARFHCTVALASPTGEVHFAEGICPGEIISEERGSNGFGYDPIFLIPELGRTMAELSMVEKNQVSHRARAVKAALPVLLSFL